MDNNGAAFVATYSRKSQFIRTKIIQDWLEEHSEELSRSWLDSTDCHFHITRFPAIRSKLFKISFDSDKGFY